MSIFSDFILIVTKRKDRSEPSLIFNFSSSEVKQGSERSQRFLFIGREVKQCSEHSQRIHFNSTPTKTP